MGVRVTAPARTFVLPDLGEGLTEAEIVRWLVAEGDIIVVDQPIVEVETAKAMVEVPSPHAGRVATRHAAEGSTLDVGAPLITVAVEKADPATAEKADPAAVKKAEKADPGAASETAAAATYREEERAGSGNVLIGYGTTPGPAAAARHRRPRNSRPAAPEPPARPAAPKVASPLVRRLARENGVDLSTLRGTGPGSVITRQDVEAAARTRHTPAAPASEPAARPAVAHSGTTTSAHAGEPAAGSGERRVPLNGFRKQVAAVLSRSRAEIPEATVWVDVDATALWELRERGRGKPGAPGLMAYVARFTVAALREYPVFNARLDTERQEIVELDRINLGIAVQSPRGLVVPAVTGAGTMTATTLDVAIRDVTARALRGESTPAELSAGTFTLNNYGAFRVDGSAAIINHPQVAMLGVGRIIDRPWVVDGALAVRKIAQLSFVFDHRVCDGGAAAGFLRSVADAMEDPSSALARL
ncbi:dihydrolipoamide acetyltransferase family protein [Actinoplanes sp. NPDC026670]|uniref:dihydrolipoamide acetyltransferase family protein n=1 Tax=Actinoplanes sp. NPDC026670 TaxID=3154700 RepID=UPI00340715D8